MDRRPAGLLHRLGDSLVCVQILLPIRSIRVPYRTYPRYHCLGHGELGTGKFAGRVGGREAMGRVELG